MRDPVHGIIDTNLLSSIVIFSEVKSIHLSVLEMSILDGAHLTL